MLISKLIHGQTEVGKPISDEPPYGATIIVFRIIEGRQEFLVLHRAIKDIDDLGDLAWTPPSGQDIPERLSEIAPTENFLKKPT